MIRFIICLSLILPRLAIAKETPASEGSHLYIQYDGVFMDELTYKDYVFKALRYDDIRQERDSLQMDFDEYKEFSKSYCDYLEMPDFWIAGAVFLLGVVVGHAARGN